MAKRIWPGTLEEQRDRDHVLALLGIVGRQQLYWTVDDVRRTMREMPHLALSYPAQLGRHVADLVPVTVLSVGQPMAGLTEEARAARTRHLYVLAEREWETATTPPPLPDPMRVYVALWVACRAVDADAVETNAVTRACSQVEALAVPDKPQMSTRLMALVNRAAPLVEKLSDSRPDEERGSRWSRWKPLGATPDHYQLDEWIEIIRHMEADRRPTAVAGYVTLHDIARDLVELAIARTVSPKWPAGHPVTMTDLEATRAEVPRARELDALLRRRDRRRGGDLARVLGDATKTRIAGRRRVTQQIVKVGRVPGGQACYDLPDRKGFEARSLYLPYKELSAAIADRTLDTIAHEARAAKQLASRAASLPGRDGSVLGAVAAVRSLLVHRELAAMEERVQLVETQRHLLSQQMREVWGRRLAPFRTLQRSIGGDLDAATTRAEQAIQPLGLDLESVVNAPRPLLVGHEYAAWVPGWKDRGRRAAELLADATTLTRYPNPDHTHRKVSEPRKAAETAVDRVDALLGLAEKYGAETLAFLEGGAALLGRSLRAPGLPTLLLTANDTRLRGQALAALVLLGAPNAEERALALLADAPHDVRSAERALQALAVLGKAEPQRWPAWLKETREPSLVRHMQALLNLPTDCRWLMRRV